MLYKYLPPSRLDVLEDCSIRFTQSYALNDPFESALKIGQTELEVAPELAKNGVKFASFSRNFENLLMWSHYTHSHAGICIGFDRGNEFFNKAIPVRYRRHRTNFNGAKYSEMNLHGDLTKMLSLEKSIDWAYEEEERIFLSDLNGNTFSNGRDLNDHEILLSKFPEDSVKSVFIGLNAKKETILKVVEIVSKMENKIDIFYARKNIDEFKLNFIRINDNPGRVLDWLENRYK